MKKFNLLENKYHVGWNLLSENRDFLMGLATLWIVCLHGTQLYKDINIPALTLIMKLGNMGVEIFLILSAIGLYYSLNYNYNLKIFYLKRIKRVLIPYLIISLWYWLWVLCSTKISILDFFKNWFLISFVTDGVTTSWYVLLILCLYLVYPIIYLLQKYNSNYILFIVLFDLIFNIFIFIKYPVFWDSIEIALTRIPTFLIGCYIAPLVKDKKKINQFNFIIEIVLAFFGTICCVAFLKIGLNNIASMIYRYTSCFIAFFICFVSIFLVSFSKNIKLFFENIGKTSFEVYLIHVFVRNILSFYKIGYKGNILDKTIIYFIMVSIVIITILIFKRYMLIGKVYKKGDMIGKN